MDLAHAASMRFDDEEHNLGAVIRGEIATHTVSFENTGPEPLIIRKIGHSCGCIATAASGTTIAPGAKGTIAIRFDTKFLKGSVVKFVYVFTNDPRYNPAILKIKANVTDDYHTTKYPADKIFYEPCARCHVSKGVGLKGRSLFYADCLMCHRQGVAGPSLTDLTKLSGPQLKDRIESGKAGSKMAPFSISRGGPLNDAEVNSIVEYITGLGK
jgi:hypothetical protein